MADAEEADEGGTATFSGNDACSDGDEVRHDMSGPSKLSGSPSDASNVCFLCGNELNASDRWTRVTMMKVQ